jgi:hypothetical protein
MLAEMYQLMVGNRPRRHNYAYQHTWNILETRLILLVIYVISWVSNTAFNPDVLILRITPVFKRWSSKFFGFAVT